MKKQILVIGLLIVLILTSSLAQARNRRVRTRRIWIPYQSVQVQKQTDQKPVQDVVQPEPEQVQENVKPEPEQVQENVKPEPEQVQENVKPEPEQVQENVQPEFGSVRAIVQVKEKLQSNEFKVNVSVDHANRIYEEDDLMTVTVESTRSGYLYLFYKDASGNATVLFPNKYHQDNYIEADKKLLIPDNMMFFKLRTAPPFGQEVLQAVVTLKPIDLNSIINFKNDQVFNQLYTREINVVEQKFNQDRDSENKFVESLIGITTYPKGQTPQAKTEQKPSLEKNDDNGKMETIDEVPPAPGDEEFVQKQEQKEKPGMKEKPGKKPGKKAGKKSNKKEKAEKKEKSKQKQDK